MKIRPALLIVRLFLGGALSLFCIAAPHALEYASAVYVPALPLSGTVSEGVAFSKDGVPISYSVQGAGEPTLVFVHGWSCNRSVWHRQVPFFAKKYRVVTLDLAGHGASSDQRSVYSMEAFGEDVAAVVRDIGATDVILIGHSMGGPVVLKAAEIIPERVKAVIGIDTLHDLDERYSPAQLEEILKPFRKNFRKATEKFLESMFVAHTDPTLVAQMVSLMSNASPIVGVSALEEMFKTPYSAQPPRVKAPVWCLNADLWPTRLDVNRRYIPDYTLRLMRGRGHFLMLEAPGEFNRKLDAIIRALSKDHSRRART